MNVRCRYNNCKNEFPYKVNRLYCNKCKPLVTRERNRISLYKRNQLRRKYKSCIICKSLLPKNKTAYCSERCAKQGKINFFNESHMKKSINYHILRLKQLVEDYEERKELMKKRIKRSKTKPEDVITIKKIAELAGCQTSTVQANVLRLKEMLKNTNQG